MLTQSEKNLLVTKFNDTETYYPKNKTIVDLFEEQAIKTPYSIAVAFEEEQISYQQLNERANKLAHYLRRRGVKEEMVVPVCADRSVEMMVSILSILKAGGAYVPIDPEYPFDRISYMLKDTKAHIMLSNSKKASKLSGINNIDSIEIDTLSLSNEPADNLSIIINPDNLAYVIYTSGTTGKPKGVMVEHRGVVSLVKGVDYVSLTNKDILLATGSPSFDATTFEYWGMLLNGGSLILCTENKLFHSELLKEEIEKRKVTKMWFASSWFNHLIESDITIFKSLKTLLVGGEKASEKHIAKLRHTYPYIEVINGYGPTENTTFSLTYTITDKKIDGPIPIGRPLNNRKAYILDTQGSLLPIGVPGEIYVGGAGLSRGYLNCAELTAEKFVRNPFCEEAEARMYKTGDLGRWLSDGNIEYLGRIDDQVKIHGYRIEPGEVESVLQEYKGVRQAAVQAREDKSGNKQLVGYIVPEGVFNRDLLVAYVKTKLPEYMVPSLWVKLERLPMTPNGKLDKKALPEPDKRGRSSKDYTAPVSELQKGLVNIWQNLLNVEQVGINDNFFELGGYSLLAIKIVSEAKKLGYKIKPKDIFIHQTISQLASVIENSSAENIINEASHPQAINEKGEYLIPIQTAGANTPFFAIRNFWLYKKLADYLGKNQPFYCLDGSPANTIDSLATHYIMEIKKIQPTGPYLLGGFCGGGLVAFEIAHQLIAQGDKVSVLALIELYTHNGEVPKNYFSFYAKKVKGLSHKLYELPSKERVHYFRKVIRTYSIRFLEKMGLIKNNDYVIKPYPGKVILIKGKGSRMGFWYRDPQMGWSAYVKGGIELVELEGDHHSIFNEPSVIKLAENLARIIEASKS